MGTQVRNNAEKSRYELFVDEALVGIADYYVQGDSLVFPHTEIDPPLRGRGFGEQLVHGALEDVRSRGHTVRPLCWFVRDFIRDNPQYADLKTA